MLLLYFDGHGTSDVFGKGPNDSIKRHRPKLPKGYKYLDEKTQDYRPKESPKEKVTDDRSKEHSLPKIPLKPVALEDVQRLAKVFKGDLYPTSLYSLIDALEAGVEASKLELEAAIAEALLYQQIEQAEREKELLNQVHRWLLNQIQKTAFTDEEIFTVLLLAKKRNTLLLN